MQLTRAAWGAVWATLLVSLTWDAGAQVVEVDTRTLIFHEPSKSSKMTVYTPELNISAKAMPGLTVAARYQADIVSGASEAVKAGPLFSGVADIVSRASVRDHRHVMSGSVAIERRHVRLNLGYSYGTENDYRSQSISVSAGTDFQQKNTDFEIGYSRGFDRVCTLAQRGLATTLRGALSSSQPCFTSSDSVDSRPIDLHGFRAVWSQVWTPVLTTQLVASGAVQHGFLANPYRQVVIGPSGQTALENHPEERRRAALTLAMKYYSKLLKTALGWTMRAYRDSWELSSAMAELSAERYLRQGMSLQVHGRAYLQTGTSFWSDDYTGGEPEFGPRGKYWSGDRELSPLQNLLVGLSVNSSWEASGEGRIGGLAEAVSIQGGFDVLRTYLKDFTWAGVVPDDNWVFLPSLSATAAF